MLNISCFLLRILVKVRIKIFIYFDFFFFFYKIRALIITFVKWDWKRWFFLSLSNTRTTYGLQAYIHSDVPFDRVGAIRILKINPYCYVVATRYRLSHCFLIFFFLSNFNAIRLITTRSAWLFRDLTGIKWKTRSSQFQVDSTKYSNPFLEFLNLSQDQRVPRWNENTSKALRLRSW